ncbi:hypothetical protein Tco_0551864 [Tanacetum coccineum]
MRNDILMGEKRPFGCGEMKLKRNVLRFDLGVAPEARCALDSLVGHKYDIEHEYDPAMERIALGSARGLAYFHEHCVPTIIRCDSLANNILLGEEFEAVLERKDRSFRKLFKVIGQAAKVSRLGQAGSLCNGGDSKCCGYYHGGVSLSWWNVLSDRGGGFNAQVLVVLLRVGALSRLEDTG